MDIQALLQALVPQRLTLVGGLERLQPGDRLSGRILEHRADGQTLVDFGRFRALAELKVPLPQDALINVRVMETGEKVHMSIVNPGKGTQTAMEVPLSRFEILTGNLFQQLRGDIQLLLNTSNTVQTPKEGGILPSAQGGQPAQGGQSVQGGQPTQRSGGGELFPTLIREGLEQIQSHLKPLNPRVGAEQLAPQIRSAVADSGIYFEKRLEGVLQNLQGRMPQASLDQLARQPEVRQLFQEDLKPNLMLLKEKLEALPRGRNPEMEAAVNRVRTTVDQMLGDIDHQQRQILSRAFGPDPEQVYSHWLHLQDDAHLSRLKIFHRKSREGDPDTPPRVSLLLDMDRLGEVRTDLFLSGPLLNLHFFVTTEGVKTDLESHLDELTAKLEEGVDEVSVQVTVSEQKVAQLKGEPSPSGPSRGLVDLKA